MYAVVAGFGVWHNIGVLHCLYSLMVLVSQLADYVDTGTTIFDIVTRYPISPKMFSHTEYRLV